MNKLNLTLLMLALLCVGFWMGKWHSKTGPSISTARCALKTGLRKLWEDHIVWTRNYIISELSDLEDLTEVTNRLLANQVDIGNAIKPFYGDEAGTKLADLLKEHIVIGSGVVKAAKAGNKQELEAMSQKWYQNADDIAAFLAGANPAWTVQALKDMLYKHLEFTTGQVTARLGKNWKSDIAFYDTNHEHMLMFSDALMQGIAKQFPDRFVCGAPGK